MRDEEIEALPDVFRAFVFSVASRVRVPFDCVLGGVFDGRSLDEIENFTREESARFACGHVDTVESSKPGASPAVTHEPVRMGEMQHRVRHS
jgi:hypothetical protein